MTPATTTAVITIDVAALLTRPGPSPIVLVMAWLEHTGMIPVGAIGTGTDIAIESGDITLISGDPNGIYEAIKLSRRTLSNIKQNLFWAYVYNIILIPVAAGVLWPNFRILLSPILAGGAMAFSSVSVVLNSLRLKTVK